MLPRLSVLLPVHNVSARYLRQAVTSILGQTEPHFEFLIVQDACDAATRRCLEEWARRDPRIRLLESPERGITRTLNHGLGFVTTAFIARMDGDDVAEPTRLAKQLAFLEQHPDVVAVGSDLLFIDPDGRALRWCRQATSHEAILERMLTAQDGAIGHPSVMLRTAAVRQVGGYDARFPFSQDLDLFLRLAEVGRLANLPLPLLEYRQHLGAVSVAKLEEQWACKRQIVNEARGRRGLPALTFPPLPKIALPAGLTYLRWAKMAAEAGEWATASRYGLWSASRLPWEWRQWLAVWRDRR